MTEGAETTAVELLSLPELWERCYQGYKEHEGLSIAAPKSTEAAAALRCYIDTATTANRRVDLQGVFSSNECEDDLATGDIKYTLVPFFLGVLLTSSPASQAEERAHAVSRALTAFERFLTLAHQYNLMGQLAHTAYEAMERSGGAMDPGTKRTLKIEQFKREKALKSQIEALQLQQVLPTRKLQVASGSNSPDTSSGTSSSWSGQVAAAAAQLEEAEERQLWRLMVESACIKALDHRAFLQQELDLIAQASQERPQQQGDDSVSASSSSSRRPDATTSHVSAAEKDMLMSALRGVMSSLGRPNPQQAREQVLRPGHLQPTMTLDELAQQEMEDAAGRDAAQRRVEEANAARRAAMDSDEEDAEDKHAARAWDDYRDAHPRGYGNSKLRPCG